MSATSSRKTLLLAGVAALVVIGGGTWWALGRQPSPAPAPAASEASATPAEAEAEEGEIDLTQEQISASGIEVVRVGQGGGSEIRLAGRIEPMIDARSSVAAAVNGRIERVLVAPGQRVRAGQGLMVIVSGDAASLNAEVSALQATAQAAEQAHQRDEELARLGVVAQREAEVSHAEALAAAANARAARARSMAAGAPNASGRFNLPSPIAGVVTSIAVGPGGFATQGMVVAEVINPERIEIVFSAPSAQAAQMAIGMPVRVSGPTGEFEASITGVAIGADATSGATQIRARARSGTLPASGSAVTGTVVLGQSTEGGLTVPTEAVQTVEGRSVVFVRSDHGFRAVQVLTGRAANGRTEILRGLNGDEMVASTKAFLLKAELAKGEAEHGH